MTMILNTTKKYPILLDADSCKSRSGWTSLGMKYNVEQIDNIWEHYDIVKNNRRVAPREFTNGQG